MAERPAPKPEVNDWQPVQASDWQDVNAGGASAPPQEGFLSSLGHAFGMDPNAPAQTIGQALKSGLESPVVPLAKSLYEGAKRSGGELMEAGKSAFAHDPAGVAYHGIKAIPIIGSGMDKAADQYADKNYTGEAGTLLGTAAQAAPAVLGGIDAAVPGRSPFAEIPTRAKAGAIFDDLKTKLANSPVNLSQSNPQLTQLEKIGAAGPGVPPTVGKLIDRSRMISPMNYPEARLFQENLSNPAAVEKAGMSGSMKGGIKQLKPAFYNDIRDTAETQGMGSDYDKAMTMYRRAATMNNMAKGVGKHVGKMAGTAALGGAGYGLYKAFQGDR